MPDDGVRAYDYEPAKLCADLDYRSCGDERAFKEVCRRLNLRLWVDDRREVVPAQALRYIGTL